MKPYGLPRIKDIEDPDLGDIARFGLKTGRLHPKWNHACNGKSFARRHWKKVERQKIRQKLRVK